MVRVSLQGLSLRQSTAPPSLLPLGLAEPWRARGKNSVDAVSRPCTNPISDLSVGSGARPGSLQLEKAVCIDTTDCCTQRKVESLEEGLVRQSTDYVSEKMGSGGR